MSGNMKDSLIEQETDLRKQTVVDFSLILKQTQVLDFEFRRGS